MAVLRVLLLVVVLALPVTIAAPTDGAQHCAALNAQLDTIDEDTWYEFCGGIMTLQAEAAVTYTQVQVSCGSNSCTYQPTMRIVLDALAPGEWVLRGESRMTNYPSGTIVSGSTRELECRLVGPNAHCDASVDNKPITAGNFNSFRYEGEWALYLVDATGAEHLQHTGENDGWLAQYY